MTKPPIQKHRQSDHVQTKVRIPSNIYERLKVSAERNGHSLNAEILAALQVDKLEELQSQVLEIKTMLRQLLDQS